VRVSELSERSGVPVATIKYYLREGLLPAGESISRRRATYDDSHVRRLRLIRALRDRCHVPVAGIGALIAALDDPTLETHLRFGRVQEAVNPADPDVGEAQMQLGRELVAGLGWQVRPSTPALGGLGAAVAAVRDLSDFGLPTDLQPWADAAWLVAQAEIDAIPTHLTPIEQAEHVALGTALFARVLIQLRLLAEQAVSSARLDAPGPLPPPLSPPPLPPPPLP
jgi:DNA-binding transcriptional MerR regulator